MPNTLEHYDIMAKELFLDLTNASCSNSIFKSGNYWQIGNVYDTLLDYMQYATTHGGKITLQDAQKLNSQVVALYGDGMSGCWYDDYCWWIIALMKSYTYPDLFYPADIAKCQTIITDAWSIINKGKPGLLQSGGAARAFDVCDQTVYGSVKPLYAGGTWQYDIFTSRTPSVGCGAANGNPIAVGSQTPQVLGPYQLAVINGLNMVMTQRMSNYKIIPRTNAARQYNFIKQWTSTAQDAADNLLNPFDSGGKYGLIRERVSKYLNSSVPMTGYNSTYGCWAGDQGTFIGGLYDYFKVSKDPNCMDLISKILMGVREKMTMHFSQGPNRYQAIYSWSGGDGAINGPDGPMSTDAADYSSGLGVFMRYLYYCCQDKGILHSITSDPKYLYLIRDTAEACYNDDYPKVYDEVPMFRQFNRLASLLAALRILPS